MLLKHLCWQHRNGVEPGQAPTFDRSCAKRWLLQECGGRSGNEPSPSASAKERRGVRMSGGMFARKLKAMAKRATAKVERPDLRSVR